MILCSSENCPIRNECYRNTTKLNENGQTWSNFEYTCNENSGFEEFMKVLKNSR